MKLIKIKVNDLVEWHEGEKNPINKHIGKTIERYNKNNGKWVVIIKQPMNMENAQKLLKQLERENRTEKFRIR